MCFVSLIIFIMLYVKIYQKKLRYIRKYKNTLGQIFFKVKADILLKDGSHLQLFLCKTRGSTSQGEEKLRAWQSIKSLISWNYLNSRIYSLNLFRFPFFLIFHLLLIPNQPLIVWVVSSLNIPLISSIFFFYWQYPKFFIFHIYVSHSYFK